MKPRKPQLHVAAADGIHLTNATCTLRVTGINDVMLQHSITVRVEHMNDLQFLSPDVMYPFTDGLAAVLNTSSSVSSVHTDNLPCASLSTDTNLPYW